MVDRSYLHTLLHLAAFAQIGVLVRIYLGLVLGGACGSAFAWVPCMTSGGVGRTGGALFTDLPANVLGSFIMGVLVSSDSLAAAFRINLHKEAPLAALPIDSPLQSHLPLLIGLRTGFCGTLTTFASWVLQMVVMMVGSQPTQGLGTEWVEGIGGLILGTLVAMASLVAGEHVALALYYRWNPTAVDLPGMALPAGPATVAAAGGGETDEEVVIEEVVLPPALERIASLSRTASVALSRASRASFRRPSTESDKAHGAAVPSVIAADEPHVAAVTAAVAAEEGIWAEEESQTDKAQQHVQRMPTTVTEFLEAAEPPYGPAQALADAFVVVVLGLLTANSLWLAVVTNNQGTGDAFRQQAIWLSVLMAPFGCLLRFHLARLNAQPWLGELRWFPVGTFAANMAACCLDFVCRAIHVRVGVSLLQASVLAALMTGVGGALSTVSTWVAEMQRLLLGVPRNSHGYIYMLTSLGTAVLLGLIIYGVPVWAQ